MIAPAVRRICDPSRVTGLWACDRRLPAEIQRTADKAFELFKRDPRHPSLQFKKLDEIWSARVGLHHRALATEVSGGFLRFWIGTYAEYDALPGSGHFGTEKRQPVFTQRVRRHVTDRTR